MAETLGYLESPHQRRGDFPSTYAALEGTHDVTDESVWDLNELDRVARLWFRESKNPERSARSKAEVDILLGRVVFEIVMRGREMIAEVTEE